MAVTLKEAIARSRERVREDAVIEARASLLPAEDRDLLLAIWTYQQPTGMVAEMCGTTPRAIRHRIRKLLDRLHSEEFIGAARVMRFLSGPQAELARLHFCQGLSVRRTASAMSISYHQARQVASEVLGLIKALKTVHAEERRTDGSCGPPAVKYTPDSSGGPAIRGEK